MIAQIDFDFTMFFCILLFIHVSNLLYYRVIQVDMLPTVTVQDDEQLPPVTSPRDLLHRTKA